MCLHRFLHEARCVCVLVCQPLSAISVASEHMQCTTDPDYPSLLLLMAVTAKRSH